MTTRLLARIALLAAVSAAPLFAAGSASADNWMFRRSYYSHTPARPVTVGNRAMGGPYYVRPQGLYVSGGYRYLRGTINVHGRIFDNYNLYESWVQTGGQF